MSSLVSFVREPKPRRSVALEPARLSFSSRRSSLSADCARHRGFTILCSHTGPAGVRTPMKCWKELG